jgi:hypothetical protein
MTFKKKKVLQSTNYQPKIDELDNKNIVPTKEELTEKFVEELIPIIEEKSEKLLAIEEEIEYSILKEKLVIEAEQLDQKKSLIIATEEPINSEIKINVESVTLKTNLFPRLDRRKADYEALLRARHPNLKEEQLLILIKNHFD